MKLLDDYKKVVECESKKRFSFVPDTMALTPQEFTEALLKYADESHLDIIITKTSMYPEFELDGVEYAADRMFGRFGAVIRCYMKNEEDGEAEDVPKAVRKKMKLVHSTAGYVIAMVIVFLFAASQRFNPAVVLIGAGTVLVMFTLLAPYKNMR